MEICVDSLESARNAIEGGAKRLEVCSALSEGGLTPSPGLIKKINSFSPVPIFAMLRLRPGNFVYTQEDMDVMLNDLEILKDHGAQGFVFGALTATDEIDVPFCKEVLRRANPLPVTFHRAFDEVADPLSSLETLIELGFRIVLTSGQQDTAEEGLSLIECLVRQARDRIIIMPGSGITKKNILKIKMETGATEFHASAKKRVVSRGNRVQIGADKKSFVSVTDRDLVREMVKIITN
ncbi:copper homeostasis protein cutC homolog [Nomia melanderi]|uniref:copper homeostasis protein cutC homolog n=1 Tax=Nomia melanderi TaxID=2448451 RepID=UPI00130430AC|nr:copper homeostasis protein cutC homolog [Nomia melanderi]